MSTILVQPQSCPWQRCINHPLTEVPILIQCVDLAHCEGFKLFQSIRAFSKKLLFIIPEMQKSTCSRKIAKIGCGNQATRS